VALGQANPRNPQVLAQLIDTITGQTIQAAKTLDDYFDDVIILPSPPLSRTPLLQAIDPSSRGLGALADFLAMMVFNGLKNEFDNGASARDDIFVVDSFKVFDTATAHFIKDKGSIDGFWFNLVHPSSLANTDYLSDAIADQLNVENSLNPRFSFT